jgi:hypothetical protein
MYTQTTTGNDSGYQHDVTHTRVGLAEEPYEEQIAIPEWRSSRAELLRNYPITIEFLSIGCIVSVGCKRIPFTAIAEGMKELNAYVEDPIASINKWEKLFEQNK